MGGSVSPKEELMRFLLGHSLQASLWQWLPSHQAKHCHKIPLSLSKMDVNQAKQEHLLALKGISPTLRSLIDCDVRHCGRNMKEAKVSQCTGRFIFVFAAVGSDAKHFPQDNYHFQTHTIIIIILLFYISKLSCFWLIQQWSQITDICSRFVIRVHLIGAED